MTSKSKYADVRHPFLYHLIFPANGQRVVKKAMAKVITAKRPVTITLGKPHVLRSKRLHGRGRTDLCSGALCTVDHAAAFPHNVEGHVDFQYSRVFIVNKLDKLGLPAECYAYEHNRADIAKLNDAPDGHDKLLAMIDRDGPITIELKPYRKRSEPGRPGKGRGKSGARGKNVGKGAKLRYATMKLGGFPDKEDK